MRKAKKVKLAPQNITVGMDKHLDMKAKELDVSRAWVVRSLIQKDMNENESK